MRLFLLWVVLGVASPIGGMTCAADMRKWTSADGKFSAEAKFVELVGDTAFLENAAGKKLRVPLAKLSAADRQYVEKLTQPPKSKPELDPPTPTPETPPVASAEPTTNVPATVDQQIDWILQASDDGEFEKVAEFAPGGAMITVAISDDGQHIVACEIGGDCRSWDVATGKQIARYEKKLGAGHHRAAISPDGKYGLLGTPTGEVHVWDATTGKHLFTHEAPEGAVQVVSVSNDGKKMGALDNTGQIVSFPLLGGMGNTLKLEERGRGAVYFDLSPNGEFFVAGRTFEADAIQGFFPQGGADGINFDLPLADQHIISVDIHPRFAAMIVEKNLLLQQLATAADFDGQVSRFDLPSRLEHPDLVRLSRAGDMALAMDRMGGIDVWQTDGQGLAMSYQTPEREDVAAIAASADALTVAYGYVDGSIVVWRLAKRPTNASLRWGQVCYERLEKAEYEEIEQLVAGLRKRDFRPHWTDAMSRDIVLVEMLARVWRRFDSRSDHVARLEKWAAKQPKSQLARLALAKCHVDDAWTARGGGFAASVTQDGWKVFHTKTDEAEELLRPVYESDAPPPLCFSLMAQVAKAQSWKGDELAELTKRMMAHQPGQHYAHSEIAVMLLPRWGGAAGESAEYAQTVADEIGKADGDGLYAQIALHLLHYHKDATFFAETKFDEARVVRGLEALCVASPQDVNLYNSALRFAYVRKHPALAKQWVEGFKEPATQWSPQVWGSLSRYKLALEFARN